MRISRKAQHAVRAALDLALHASSNRGVPSAEIARRTGVPEKFLEAILRDLREAGIVTSKRGPDGGHRLAGDPAKVTVRVLVEAIDGSFSTATGRQRGRATSQDSCIRSLWRRVETAVLEVLESVTLEDMRHESGSPEPLDFTI